MHARIAERIVRSAELAPGAVVCEVGPGTGILTRELLKRAKKVIAIEADKELCEKLRADFAEEIASGRLNLVCGDIRAFDISALPRGYALIANIPYYLTGGLFRLFLEADNQPSALTLLVQKEVADRIVARGGKESILSLSVKAYGAPKREFLVPRGAFAPAPSVDSAVLAVRGISRANFRSRGAEERFFALLRAGFAHKRKFALKNLKEAGFATEGVPEKARAEDLPLSVWLGLAHRLM